MAVLDISKTLMYDFHYSYMLKKYGDRISLNYGDTDSLLYSVITDNFYDDIKNDLNDFFDTSNFKENNIYNLPLVNKKVLGKFKDECALDMLIKYFGVRSKSYCLINDSSNTTKKIKGIKKNVVNNNIDVKDFENCIFENVVLYRSMRSFKSKLHNIYTQIINKKALENLDDKRFQIPNSYKTLPWGHIDIAKYK